MAAYKWKTASYIKANAEEAGKMCEELEKTVGLTAETLLEANSSENAPLHNEFEWDDSKAAHSYRLQQARHIINCLVIVPEGQTTNTTSVRAFFNIEENSPKYESVNAILQNEDKHQKLLNRAFSELRAFQKKYSTLEELTPLYSLIEEITA